MLNYLGLVSIEAQHSLVKYDYPINTNLYDEICPIVSFDEDYMFFTRIGSPDFDQTLYIDSVNVFAQLDESDFLAAIQKVYKQIESKEILDVVSSSFNQDIWVVSLDQYKKAKNLFHPGHPINNALPNSICSRYDDHGRFIVINQFEEHGGLDKGFSVTQMKNGLFSFPEPILIENFHMKSGRVNLTSSLDQRVLFLSLPSGNGDMDLFVSERLYHMHYSKPVKILSGINTEFNEMTPYLLPDNQTMYFVSDRPESLGGTDIFMAKRKGKSYLHWEEATCLLPPVNSIHDELYPHFLDSNNKLLFSSNRDGSQDIFNVSMVRDEQIKINLEVHILNGLTQKYMPAELFWEPLYEIGEENKDYFRVRNGRHAVTITENRPFIIRAVNRNMSSQIVIIDPQELWAAGELTPKIELVLSTDKPVQVDNRKISLETISFREVLEKNKEKKQPFESAVFKNIMFEQSTARILPHSLPIIHALANFLITTPDIVIEIQGHTDNVGDPNDLANLSLDRANTIKQLLVEQNIETSRIKTVGFGAEKPINDNSNEELRRKNRRVEIYIIQLENPSTP